MNDHYSRLHPEPIEVIEAWGLDFHLGNVISYIARAPHKGEQLRDLQKAEWYIHRRIQFLEAEMAGVPCPPPEPQA